MFNQSMQHTNDRVTMALNDIAARCTSLEKTINTNYVSTMTEINDLASWRSAIVKTVDTSADYSITAAEGVLQVNCEYTLETGWRLAGIVSVFPSSSAAMVIGFKANRTTAGDNIIYVRLKSRSVNAVEGTVTCKLVLIKT